MSISVRGRSSRSQGLTYLGKAVGDGSELSFDITGIAAELRLRVGSLITATVVDNVNNAGTSEFARNVSVRRP